MSTPTQLRISPAHLAAIAAHLQDALPNESCGLLIGRQGGAATLVDEVVRSANLSAAPDAFEVDPALLLRFQRELRGSARRLVGLYHSHPEGRPEPSARDIAGATYPGFVWLISARDKGGAVVHRAFRHPPEAGVPPQALPEIALVIAAWNVS